MLEQFDASRLEELAESLLADVITDLGADPAPGGRRAAAHEGAAERLPGPLVGSQPVQLESAEDNRNGGGCLMRIVSAAPVVEEKPTLPLATNKQRPVANGACGQLKQEVGEADESILYGSYDEQNHCITIVMNDGAEDIAFGEVVEEVQSFELEHDYVSKIPLLSPIPSTVDDDVYDCKDQLRSMPMSDEPMPPLSDYGYESLIASPAAARTSTPGETHSFDCASSLCSSSGSGGTVGDLDELLDFDDMWNSSFQELFPSLL